MRSLSKHVNDIVSDSRIMNNDILGLTETQISLSDSTSTCRIVETRVFIMIVVYRKHSMRMQEFF